MCKIAFPISWVKSLPEHWAYYPMIHLKSFTVQTLEFISSVGSSDNALASSVFPNFIRFNFTADSSSVEFLQITHHQSSSLAPHCTKPLAFLCCTVGTAFAWKHYFAHVDSVFWLRSTIANGSLFQKDN